MWKASPGKTVLKNDISSLRCDKRLCGNGPPGARDVSPLPCGSHSENVLSLAVTIGPF